ncbi:hypothetical protein CSW58_12920, partial [Caulobacter sp. B11]
EGGGGGGLARRSLIALTAGQRDDHLEAAALTRRRIGRQRAPIMSTMAWLIDRPRPVPPNARVTLASP